MTRFPHRLCMGLLSLALTLAGCRAEIQPDPAVTAQATPATVALAATATVLAATAMPLSPTSTLTPTPVPTSTPTPTSSPTSAPSPTPTSTPAPRAMQLTTGGCCTQPFWAPDSRQVRFIDKPNARSAVGIWGVNIDEPLSEPVFVTGRLEESLAEPDYLVETDGAITMIERRADGERWRVPANGETVLFSPGRTRIAWAASGDPSIPPEQRVTRVWVANLDGSNPRQVATLPRGGLSGWISDDALLISGSASLQTREQIFSALSLNSGDATELARAERLRSPSLSPSRQWLVYYVTFAADRPQNGMWLVRTDGSERRRVDRELFGAYQWRGCGAACTGDEDRLLIIPFRPDAALHELWEVDAATGQTRQLTDAASTPFKIANGDWRASPDGRYVAFVESNDHNVWLLDLPE